MSGDAMMGAGGGGEVDFHLAQFALSVLEFQGSIRAVLNRDTGEKPRSGGRISFLGPFWGLQPQFKDPHHLEWLIRRLSASSIGGRKSKCGGRLVRARRRVLRFRRAPPRLVSRAFARG